MANLAWWWPPLIATAVFLLASFAIYKVLSRRIVKRTEQRWLDQFHRGQFRGPYQILGNMRMYTSPYGTEQRLVKDEYVTALEQGPDEKVLLGPVSAWVAEGEARAVRDWGIPKNGDFPPQPKPSTTGPHWVTVYHLEQDAYHRIPNDPVVIADFRTRGWEVAAPPALPSSMRKPERR